VKDAGGTVFLPPGFYPCNLTLPSTVSLQGAGEASQAWDYTRTRLRPAKPEEPVIRVPASNGLRIRDLALFGPGAFVAGSTGIRVAADAPGARGVLAGYSTMLEGVQCTGFEVGFFIASYRVLAQQCAGTKCKYNWFISNPKSGRAEVTPNVHGYPSDHVTLINCIAAFPCEEAEGQTETAPKRTSYGVYANSVRCLTLIGCDVGQCGIGLHLEGCVASVNCHIEGTDGPGMLVRDSEVQAGTLSTLYSGGIRGEGGGLLALSALTTAGSPGPAFVTVQGGYFVAKSERPLMVERRDDANNLLGYNMTNGSRLTLVLEQGQTIQPANRWTEVAWARVLNGDDVETGKYSNYTPNGRWKCPAEGRYRFQFTLSKSDPKAGRVWVKLNEWFNGNINRDFLIDGPVPGNDGRPLTGTITVDCHSSHSYSLAVQGEGTSAITVGGGAGPYSGQPISRMSISSE
jgi:hypothetical protein